MLNEHKLMETGFWTQKGPNSDTVISSRVRFARNMRSVPYPNKIDPHEIELLRGALERFATGAGDGSYIIDLNEIDKTEKRFLRERNIITLEMERSPISSVLVNEDEEFSIMVNEDFLI